MTMRIGGILAAAVLIAAALPALAQETYPTPEAAVKDLVDSAKAKTPGFGDRILGKEGAALLRSGDADEDAENLKEFNQAAAAQTAIDDGPNGTKILRVGKNGGPCRCRSSRPMRVGASTSQREGGNDQSPRWIQRAQRH